jgi:hypothetical protein
MLDLQPLESIMKTHMSCGPEPIGQAGKTTLYFIHYHLKYTAVSTRNTQYVRLITLYNSGTNWDVDVQVTDVH